MKESVTVTAITFPDASNPTIRIRMSLFPNNLFHNNDNDIPIVLVSQECVLYISVFQIYLRENKNRSNWSDMRGQHTV
jgi:hypothetical protein